MSVEKDMDFPRRPKKKPKGFRNPKRRTKKKNNNYISASKDFCGPWALSNLRRKRKWKTEEK